jgi:hypothetical protein
MSPEAFEELPEAEREAIEAKVQEWSDKLADLLDDFPGWRREVQEAIDRAEREVLAPTVDLLMRGLRERYADLDRHEASDGRVGQDLGRVHDVVIRHQFDGDRHAMPPQGLEGSRARDGIGNSGTWRLNRGLEVQLAGVHHYPDG